MQMHARQDHRLERQLRSDSEESDGFALLDRDLRFCEVNAAMAAINGLPASEHLGRTVAEILPTLAPTIEPLLREVFDTATPVLDVEIYGDLNSSNVTRRWLASYYPVRSRGGTVTAVDAVVRELPLPARWKHTTASIAITHIANDATDADGSQSEALDPLGTPASAERLRGALQAAGMIAWELDPIARTIAWSPGAAAFFQMPLDGAGLAFADVMAAIHPEDRTIAQAAVQRALQEGVYESELRLVRPDGSVMWLRSRGEVIPGRDGMPRRILGISQDSTIYKLNEQAARRANEQLARALERLDGFLYEYDVLTGATFRSDGFARVLGYAPDDVPATDTWWRDQMHPDDRDATIEDGQASFESDAPAFSQEYRVRHRDGHYLTVWDRGDIIRDANGRVLRVLGTTINITGRKQADAERRELLLRERQAHQLTEEALARAEAATRERDLLISIAAHDLRTPLTVILGQSQLLKRRAQRLGLDERNQLTIATIAEQAERLSHMITALLDLSRIQEGRLTIQPEPVDLAELLLRVVSTVKATLTVHDVIFNPPDVPLSLLADPLRLEQVFHNLLGNAVKYSPDGGAITLWTELAAQHVRVLIRDEGIGIPEEARPHLFNRFYRAPNATAQATSSLGIGLFVVRELVHAHGGTVAVESTLGAGSTFTVELPLVR
jgi:PAS domain S-box-containing protein